MEIMGRGQQLLSFPCGLRFRRGVMHAGVLALQVNGAPFCLLSSYNNETARTGPFPGGKKTEDTVLIESLNVTNFCELSTALPSHKLVYN